MTKDEMNDCIKQAFVECRYEAEPAIGIRALTIAQDQFELQLTLEDFDAFLRAVHEEIIYRAEKGDSDAS
jgi:hypothetical protein